LSQIDERLPEAQRRVEVSVQKTIEDSQGHFAGVIRVGLMKSEIDGAVERHITAPGEDDPHLIFICDKQGRLITGFGNRDHIVVSGDDLRLATSDIPPVITRALQERALQEVDPDHLDADTTTSFRFLDKIYLGTFRYLPGTQDWIVGIVVPRDFYLGKLVQMRQQILGALLLLIALIIMAGASVLGGTADATRLIALFSNQIYMTNTCPYTASQASWIMGSKPQKPTGEAVPMAPPLLAGHREKRVRPKTRDDSFTRPRVDAASLSAMKTGEFWARLANGQVVKGKAKF
jgi:hypothetical protein